MAERDADMEQQPADGDRGSRSGMSNADFARMFRREARSAVADAATDAAAVADSTRASADNSANDDGLDAEMPRGFGLDSARRDFMALGRPLVSQRETGAAESATAARIGGLGLGAHARDSTNASSSAASSGAQCAALQTNTSQAPAMSCAQLACLGKWEKHTKGFGMKMLAKMGFKGRLGKDEQGVSATVEVVQRPALMGIGFGNFTEASALRHNRKLQRELRGETVEDDVARKQQEAAADADDDDTLWRKRKAPTAVDGGTKRYRRAADVSHDAELAKKSKRSDVVLDMRGPDVRVLSSVSDAYAVDAQRLTAAKPKLGDELIYNVRMVVNVAQSAIVDLTSKVAHSAASIASAEKETAILDAQVAMERVRLQHVEAMMRRMRELEAEADAAATRSSDVRGIIELLTDVRAASPQEFEAYRLQQLVASLCVAPLKALLTGCDLAQRETQRHVVEQFSVVQVFLLHVPSASSTSSTTTPGAVFHHIHEKVSSDGEDLYNYILEQTLWPALNQFVTSQWRVRERPLACIELFELLAPHLSRDCEHAFLHQLVLPRLKTECQRWRPQSDLTPIHDWLLPWRSLLGSAMESLYPDTRLALAHALNQWHPSDQSVLVLLAPWRDVWGEHEYAKFTHRHVVRKLVRCLHRDFEVNPAKQSLDALTWVLAWQNHLPERQFVALLEGEFFPMWLRVLRQWVATSDTVPNLTELETWYRGWKSFFEKHQLASHHRLVVHFHGALVLLEAACDRYTSSIAVSAVSVPGLNCNAPSSYQDALVKARADDPAAEDGVSSSNDDALRASSANTSASSEYQHQQAQTKKRAASHAVGLKDVIENLAIAHNVLFLPRGVHDGQQVYVFGKHHIVIDQGVVFAEKTKGSFEPVDIEQLL